MVPFAAPEEGRQLDELKRKARRQRAINVSGTSGANASGDHGSSSAAAISNSGALPEPSASSGAAV